MVLYFTTASGLHVYMGRDKHENERLIEFAWAEDFWFHVDDLSSAHVYVRFPRPGTKHAPCSLDDLPADLIESLAQLVKANSIEGCKKSSVSVVYTAVGNLKKTEGMACGQVGFFDRTRNAVRHTTISTNREIVRALNKTKVVMGDTDLRGERAQRDAEVEETKKRRRKAQKKAAAMEKMRLREEAEARSYDRVMGADTMTSNEDVVATGDTSAAVMYEEDFM
jgi:predicted ribosome quality control (RQC) complex YloA/Tae2 family protein